MIVGEDRAVKFSRVRSAHDVGEARAGPGTLDSPFWSLGGTPRELRSCRLCGHRYKGPKTKD